MKIKKNVNGRKRRSKNQMTGKWCERRGYHAHHFERFFMYRDLSSIFALTIYNVTREKKRKRKIERY